MSERDFAWSGVDVAAQQTRITGGVMRRAEWTVGYQRLAGGQQAHDAVNLGRLQGFLQGKRRQNGCQPLGKHGFTSARWANQKYIMTASSGDLQSALHRLLPFDLGKINLPIMVLLEHLRDIDFGGRNLDLAF